MGVLLTKSAEYSNHLTFLNMTFLPKCWTGPVWLQKSDRPRVRFTDMVMESSIRRCTISAIVWWRPAATQILWRWRRCKAQLGDPQKCESSAAGEGGQQGFEKGIMAGGRTAHSIIVARMGCRDGAVAVCDSVQ